MRLSRTIETGGLDALQAISTLCAETAHMREATAADYRKAVTALQAFVQENPIHLSAFSDKLVLDWVVSMFWCGLTAKTAAHYLDMTAALCSSAAKAGRIGAETVDMFRRIKAKVRALAPEAWRRTVSGEDFARFAAFVRLGGRHAESDTALFADMLLLSMTNGAMPLADVSRLKRSDLDERDATAQAVVRRHADARRRYIFPLQQAELTPQEVDHCVRTRIVQLLAVRNIALTGNADETIKTYWAFAALQSGLCGSQAVEALGAVPAGLPVLALCADYVSTGAALSGTAAFKTVAALFGENPAGWYAMRLRSGVTFDGLKARLAALPSALVPSELFYPMDEIVRRRGKKIVRREIPVLPGIVFFKSRPADVQTLFSRIGDLAWCYKSARSDGAGYAEIPETEMERFRQAVGAFTSETEILPLGATRLRKNDRVEILGGMFAGYSAKVDAAPHEEAQEAGGRVIYRLMLAADNGIEWVVKVDSRLVRPAADEKRG